MAENFRFGIEITGTESIDAVTNSLKRLDAELTQKQTAFRELGTTMGSVSKKMGGLDVTSPSIEKLGKTTEVTSKEMKKMSEVVASPTGIVQYDKTALKFTGTMDGLNRSIKEIDPKGLESGIGGISKEAAVGTVALSKFGEATKGSAIAIEDMDDTTKNMVRGQLAMRSVYRQTGQEIFWIGLGSMFLVMSYARVRRATQSLETAHRSLDRTLRRTKGSQEDYMEAVALYGAGSREARDANDRYKDSLDSIEQAESNVTAAAEQEFLAWMMLAFGAAPSLTRAVFSVRNIMQDYHTAQIMSTQGVSRLTAAHILATKSTGTLTIAKTASVVATKQVTLSETANIAQTPAVVTSSAAKSAGFWSMGTALAFATMGVSALIAGLAILSMQSVTKNTSDFRQEIDMTSHSLAGSGLVEALEIASDRLGEFKGAISEVQGREFRDINVVVDSEGLQSLKDNLTLLRDTSKTIEISGVEDFQLDVPEELQIAGLERLQNIVADIPRALQISNIEEVRQIHLPEIELSGIKELNDVVNNIPKEVYVSSKVEPIHIPETEIVGLEELHNMLDSVPKSIEISNLEEAKQIQLPREIQITGISDIESVPESIELQHQYNIQEMVNLQLREEDKTVTLVPSQDMSDLIETMELTPSRSLVSLMRTIDELRFIGEEREIVRIEPRMEGIRLPERAVEVNITFGDVTVREEADIDAITMKIKKVMNKEIVNLSGGRTFI